MNEKYSFVLHSPYFFNWRLYWSNLEKKSEKKRKNCFFLISFRMGVSFYGFELSFFAR